MKQNQTITIISSPQKSFYLKSLLHQTLGIAKVYTSSTLSHINNRSALRQSAIIVDLDEIENLLDLSFYLSQPNCLIGISQQPELFEEIKYHYSFNNVLHMPEQYENLKTDNWTGLSFAIALKNTINNNEILQIV